MIPIGKEIIKTVLQVAKKNIFHCEIVTREKCIPFTSNVGNDLCAPENIKIGNYCEPGTFQVRHYRKSKFLISQTKNEFFLHILKSLSTFFLKSVLEPIEAVHVLIQEDKMVYSEKFWNIIFVSKITYHSFMPQSKIN